MSISTRITRKLFDPISNNYVSVSLDAPIEVDIDEWCCKIQIIGSTKYEKNVYGHDAFQSLFLALSVIRKQLSNDYKNLVWDEIEDHGFPFIIPCVLNKKPIVRGIEKMIDEELSKPESWR